MSAPQLGEAGGEGKLAPEAFRPAGRFTNETSGTSPA
jgi:hypothetical protein